MNVDPIDQLNLVLFAFPFNKYVFDNMLMTAARMLVVKVASKFFAVVLLLLSSDFELEF